MEEKNKKGRVLKGIVFSDKMNKTCVVSITRLKKHPKYQKFYKLTEKYKAHDDKQEYKKGDKVLIQECRPLSKQKRWIIIRRQ
jgi:small subunit ribosomal protein S17